MSAPKRIKNLNISERQTRQMNLTISMFLLGNETMKGLVWTVHKVDYNRSSQTVKIGIDTVKSKLGTTLSKMRKLARPLAEYLFESGLTFRIAQIEFYVNKENESVQRIYSILDKVSL